MGEGYEVKGMEQGEQNPQLQLRKWHCIAYLDRYIYRHWCFERIGSLQIPRIHLQRLVKCLDQKVTTVRQQSTGSSLLVLSMT